MLYTAFILGLLGSFHCIGMCGPIAFMLPVSRDNKLKKFFQIFLYHGGRLLAYSTIGLVFGVVGKSLNLFGMQQQLSIFIGILMILVILIPAAKFNKYNFSRPINRFIGKIKFSMGAAFKKKTPDTFFTIGFLNGLLPCGLVYMAVFGAVATGSILSGSAYMLLFGLGTMPLMTTAVYFSNLLSNSLRLKMRKLVPVFIIIIGSLFILRGLGLGIPYVSPQPVNQQVTATLNCH
ncbi:sulfite exporter TauE/SafE family protein [Antarcticibacterium sp. 1MA-6-2]|uniref:sulfite exporter TauE/SafE family protein n=1 Tax=Antarcticibacterium sp. 1MA-6-2 TaxID=2908210 RepID=UPI001F1964D5|nr:sulfite exporter TauE/SafE family protein [Antarcticibacterium sp. 1MA-6-2]UJH90839.1 sulfite exporter TauE/SafE family protein [Antarcticibacterium sp. 1MA-6-2]